MFCVRHLRLVPAVPVLFIMCAVFVGTDVHFVHTAPSCACCSCVGAVPPLLAVFDVTIAVRAVFSRAFRQSGGSPNSSSGGPT